MPEFLLPQKYWQNTGSESGHEQNPSPDPAGKLVPGLFKEIKALDSCAVTLSRISTLLTFCFAILKEALNFSQIIILILFLLIGFKIPYLTLLGIKKKGLPYLEKLLLAIQKITCCQNQNPFTSFKFSIKKPFI